MAQSDMLPCAKTFQRLSGAVQEQGWTETAAELREAFAGWVKRTDAFSSFPRLSSARGRREESDEIRTIPPPPID